MLVVDVGVSKLLLAVVKPASRGVGRANPTGPPIQGFRQVHLFRLPMRSRRFPARGSLGASSIAPRDPLVRQFNRDSRGNTTLTHVGMDAGPGSMC